MAATLTFLAVVNDVLRKVGVVRGDSGELTTFTDSARQQDVDTCLDAINDVIDLIYTMDDDGRFPIRGGIATSTFVLAENDRDYSLAADFVAMEGNPIDAANSHVLTPYPGGWLQYREDYPDPSDLTGRPNHWMLNPGDGELEIDTTPTSSEVGETYSYAYEKAINLSATTDTFPFDDEVTRALKDAFAEKWLLDRRKSAHRPDVLAASVARGVARLRNTPHPKHYGTRRAHAPA